jgi:hypothetical protein
MSGKCNGMLQYNIIQFRVSQYVISIYAIFFHVPDICEIKRWFAVWYVQHMCGICMAKPYDRIDML